MHKIDSHRSKVLLLHHIVGHVEFMFVLVMVRDRYMGGAPIGAGGHDPPLLEAKGTGDIIWG